MTLAQLPYILIAATILVIIYPRLLVGPIFLTMLGALAFNPITWLLVLPFLSN